MNMQHLGKSRYRLRLDDLWQAARSWASEQGFVFEHGKYQGTPPT